MLDKKTKVTTSDFIDQVTVKQFYAHLHSPIQIYHFKRVAELETPSFNGLRRFLRLESAEPHSILVFDQSMRSRATDYAHFKPPKSVVDTLESKGYMVYTSKEKFHDNYSDEKEILNRKGERVLREYEREKERIEDSYEIVERTKKWVEDKKQSPCSQCPGFEYLDRDGGEHTRDCPNYFMNSH